MEWVRYRVQLTPRACASGTRSVVVHLSVGTRTPVLQIQAVMLVLNTFKLCKTLKTALSVLIFARYTPQTLKVLRFEMASRALYDHTQIPSHLVSCSAALPAPGQVG